MDAIVAGAVFLPKKLIDVRAIKHDLTVKQWVMGEEEAVHVPAYEDDGEYLAVPRSYGLKLIAKLRMPYRDMTSAGHPASFPVEVVHSGQYEYQNGFVEELLSAAERLGDFMAEAATGKGKCLAKGTPILMYDGSVRRVEHVEIGDLLMGPDSTPRRVVSLASGREEMFQVSPVKGEPYTVNRSHILSLRITGAEGRSVTAGNGNKYYRGDIVDISVDDYLKSSSTFKHVAKGWRTGVEFPNENYIPIPPYILGSWLGDGSSRYAMLFCDDAEVVSEWRCYAAAIGSALTRGPEAGVGTYRVTSGEGSKYNRLMQELRGLNLLQNKHIPEEYLTASRADRLEVLAGIVDTDGCVSCGCFDIIFVNQRLAEDTAFLARSLGLAAYVYPCRKECVNTGVWGTYYRIRISGEVSIVPCRVPRKRALPRRQKKNVLNVGVSVASVGEGEYFGFEIDGDRRFLLGDFTVTHNTVMALSAAQKLGRTTLVLVDQDNLKQQWVGACKKILKLPAGKIGEVQGPKCDYKGKSVVIAMIQSLVQREYPEDFYDHFGTVIVDEVHTAGAPTFSQALVMFSATVRFGVSATIDRRDALQRILHWNLGEVAVSLQDTHEKSYVYYLESESVYSWYANISPKIGRILTEVSEDAVRNLLIAHAVKWLYDSGRDVLVISDRIEQLENLMAMAYYLGMPRDELGLYCGFYNRWAYEKDPKPKRRPHGYERGTEYTPVRMARIRKRTPKATLAKILESSKVVYATFGMFAKGVDVPRLSGGIDCTPRSRAAQVHGRVLRQLDAKLVPIWVTIRDINSYRLDYQFLQRLDEYLADSAEIYKWNPEKGVRLVDVKELKREVRANVKELKAMNITTHADGSYMLTTPPTPSV